jgi:hypothetical protein
MNFFDGFKNSFGLYALECVKKLHQAKLAPFSIYRTENFSSLLKRIFNIYYKNLSVEKNNLSSLFQKTKQFIKCLPGAKTILKFISQKQTYTTNKYLRNAAFFKVCLDVLLDYYKNFDFPLFRIYKNKFLPTALKFYSNLTEETFEFIKIHDKNINSSLISSKIF